MKKNWFWRMACIVVVGILLTLVFTAYMERQESEYVYEKIEKMIPGERELLKYGLEDEGLFYVPEVIGMSGLILLVCGAMIFECVQYKKEQNQRIEELERYCERILEGKDTLDLRDNEEGQFSILKNQVHDLTVMLKEQNESLERNKREMERMIADISHQLKTPITSLNMINEILYMELPGEKKAEFLDNMQKDLMKIEWLIKTVLQMAKLDSNTLVLEKEKVSAAELSQEIQEYFTIFCEVNESRIRIEGAENLTFFCDRKWTKEAIQNIVKNGMEHGGKKIILRWEENTLYTMLQIEDDGEGIEREELPHIFERFYKTKQSKENSLGLGLAFAKSIMLHQNGDIRVKSKKGMGTVFTLKFYKNLLHSSCTKDDMSIGHGEESHRRVTSVTYNEDRKKEEQYGNFKSRKFV